MRLSLFGYDFQMDYRGLTGAATSGRGSRVDRQSPDNSLLIRKPLGELEHEGGQRFEPNSWEHHLLRRWIQTRQQLSEPLELSRLEVEPREIVFAAQSKPVPLPVPLRVVAVWKDGTREDVTPLCRFRANDDGVATVDRDGLVSTEGPGDTHVVAFYDNGVIAVPILRPVTEDAGAAADALAVDLAVDEERGLGQVDAIISAKLKKLGVTPSAICSDTEFLRRASIDITGTLPTPAEVKAFLADSRADKRSRKVEELISRPAYAAWWANKLCDFTGCNPRQQAELGQETSVQWYMWIYQRLRENTPYDELVQRIVLAQGRLPDQSYDQYAEEMSSYFRDEDAGDFSLRATMPHYWTRRSMKEPKEAAQAFAQNFLGVRLQCAQCHKHPFAPWTQKDFTEFSRFFERVEYGVAPNSQESYRALAKQVGVNVRNSKGEEVRLDTLRRARRGGTIPWRELYVLEREKPEAISLLRQGEVTLRLGDDPREPIMEWMLEPENPYFARAIVNRVWAGYFHIGMIDPTDDLTPANPPSHPELLAWLTQGFVESGYDMQWLHRQIANSRAYQRSWKPNATNRHDRRNYSRAIPRRLPAEIVYDAIKQAVAADDQLDTVRTDLSRRAIGHLSMRLAETHAMQVFGKPSRAVNCDCERSNNPTLLQAVFLQNDPLVEQLLDGSGWLESLRTQDAASGSQVVAAVDEPDQRAFIEQAWLRTLSRPPSSNEVERAMRHLQKEPSLTVAMRDLLWSLINTKEFILSK